MPVVAPTFLFTCVDYAADHNGRRCRHCGVGGHCKLVERTRCEEWLRVNPDGPSGISGCRRARGRNDRHVGTSVCGAFAAPIAEDAADPPSSAEAAPPTADELAAMASSWRDLGVEIRFSLRGGSDVWLVAAYTDQDRTELTPEHAALMAAILATFPGARIESL